MLRRKLILVTILVLVLANTTNGFSQSSPTPTECKPYDDRFVRTFDWGALGIAALLASCILPFFLPRAMGYRFWWLTQPISRWLIIAGLSNAILAALFVGFPFMSLRGWIPPGLGLFLYWDVDPNYIQCATTNINAVGLLGGLIGAGRSPSIIQTAVMLYLFIAASIMWAIIYWAAFFLVRTQYGLENKL